MPTAYVVIRWRGKQVKEMVAEHLETLPIKNVVWSLGIHVSNVLAGLDSFCDSSLSVSIILSVTMLLLLGLMNSK